MASNPKFAHCHVWLKRDVTRWFPEQTRENVILAATILQQEAGVLISTLKRVRRKRVRTSPLSSSPGTLTYSVLSGAGARVGLSSGPARLQWETSIRRAVPDSGDVRTRFLRTRLGVEIKTPASCCSIVAAKMTFSLVCSGLKSTCDVTF